MENTKKIIKTKIYKMTVAMHEDGTSSMTRINDGFGPLELIGMLEFSKDEIIKQIKGNIKPDIIKRQVVID